MKKTPAVSFETIALLLFALSGFAGLIYESIWTHYLKLILGHAAYAQSLVLAIFMGGMALGAWLVSRLSGRLHNLLIAYAVIEGFIGIAALVFHSGFIWTENQLLLHWLPAIGDPQTANILKWGASSLLILPQSILLGATFPLMSGALIRIYPDRAGNSLSFLYFSNSMGAAIGVLVSGFVLLEAYGLPGTVFFAGVVSIAVSLFAFLLARSTNVTAQVVAASTIKKPTSLAWILMVAALITGMASFIYEIGWVRMLSLVLGTSNQSFELMLSAFIGGLALGALWIRKRIDKVDRPLLWAANVQLLMGALALLSIPLYMQTFDLMAQLLESVQRDDQGFTIFRIGSHTIAMMLMLPPTFMAGMTLPLFTYSMIRSGGGEASIGRIYASNTLGAILGVVVAVHWGMPNLGLKGIISLGAGLDIALGMTLLLMVRNRVQRDFALPLGIVLACLVLALFVDFDVRRLAAGIYRSGLATLPTGYEVVFHKDGATASVDMIADTDSGRLMLATNGKVDASIMMRGPYPSADEYTQALLGLIPMALRPDAERAAVIGLGSGMSTHVLLGSTTIKDVITIEIEPTIIEAARKFGVPVERAFLDPRSEIVVEDARTWFSSQKIPFDIIVSEPSNPWVSGIAALFTQEFYRQVKSHLSADGVFVQWLHLYEINSVLVSSVIKAIGQEFEDYAIFQTVEGTDIALVASNGDLPNQLDFEIFQEATLKPLFERLVLITPNDIAVRYLGDRRLFEPYVDRMPTLANSDFYPVLNLNSPRAFFLRQNAKELTLPSLYAIPVVDMISGRYLVDYPFVLPDGRVSSNYAYNRREALHISAVIAGQSELAPENELLRKTLEWKASVENCDYSTSGLRDFIAVALELAKRTNLFMAPVETRRFWEQLMAEQCNDDPSKERQAWLALHRAAGLRDANALIEQSELLLTKFGRPQSPQAHDYLLIAAMTGYLAKNNPEGARQIWNSWGTDLNYLGDRATLAVVHAIAFDSS